MILIPTTIYTDNDIVDVNETESRTMSTPNTRATTAYLSEVSPLSHCRYWGYTEGTGADTDPGTHDNVRLPLQGEPTIADESPVSLAEVLHHCIRHAVERESNPEISHAVCNHGDEVVVAVRREQDQDTYR